MLRGVDCSKLNLLLAVLSFFSPKTLISLFIKGRTNAWNNNKIFVGMESFPMQAEYLPRGLLVVGTAWRAAKEGPLSP